MFLSLFALFFACNEPEFTNLDEEPVLGGEPADIALARQDTTVQIPQPAVDILFVIDNSGSMDAEQAAIARNFPVFAEYFALSGIDYHIGVVSTDMDDPSSGGRLRRAAGVNWIDRDTPNPSGVFSQMAQMGTTGSATEQGRAAAWAALELNADLARNEGFEREDAELHILFISDEDDASTNELISRPEFVSWMKNRKAEESMVKAHAVIWPVGERCDDGWSEGYEYQRYARRTGGIVGNICDTDWAPFMDELGLVTSGLKTEFFLSELPELDPWTLEVSVRTTIDGTPVTRRFETCRAGEGCAVEYREGLNSVQFLDYVPAPFDEVLIDYEPRSAR